MLRTHYAPKAGRLDEVGGVHVDAVGEAGGPGVVVEAAAAADAVGAGGHSNPGEGDGFWQLRYDMGFWPDQATARQALNVVDRVRAASCRSPKAASIRHTTPTCISW